MHICGISVLHICAAAKPWGRPASRNANVTQMSPKCHPNVTNDAQMSQKGAQRTAKTILKVVPVKGVFRTLTGTARFDQLWIQSDPNGDPLAPIDAQSEPNGDQIFQSGASIFVLQLCLLGGGGSWVPWSLALEPSSCLLAPGVDKTSPRRLDLMTFWPWLQKSRKPVPGGSI